MTPLQTAADIIGTSWKYGRGGVPTFAEFQYRDWSFVTLHVAESTRRGQPFARG